MAVGAIAVGTGLSILGGLAESKAQVKVSLAEADAKRLQANEILNRAEINVQAFGKQARQLKSSQVGAFAKGGVDVGGASVLLQLEQTDRDVQAIIRNTREEANFEVENLLRGAEVDEKTAKQLRKLGFLKAFGTGLQGAGSIARGIK